MSESLSFKIEVNKADLNRILRALVNFVEETKRQQDRMPMMCALDFKGLLIKNLFGQKFAGSYPDYNERYAEWLEDMGLLSSKEFWTLYGDLINNIDSFKISDSAMTGHFAGIRAGIMDKGGKSWFGTPDDPKGLPREIAKYARKAEEKRPLFRPTHEEYATSGFSIRGKEALVFMKNQWK